MKTRKISLAIGIGLTWLVIFGISNSLAAPSQWFPADKTTFDYTLTNYTNWQNGTSTYNTRFNVYNSSANLMIYPTKLDAVSVPYIGWTLLKADAVIKMRHVYADATSTTLNRSTYFLVNNVTYGNNVHVFLVSAHSNNSYTFLGYTGNTNIPYQKNAFVNPPGSDTTDYFNNVLTPGQVATPGYRVLAVTSDRIIAMEDFSDSNFTYVADLSGKVISYTYSTSFALNTVPNLMRESFMFETSSSASSSLPGFPLEWLLIIVSTSIAFIVGMARWRKHGAAPTT